MNRPIPKAITFFVAIWIAGGSVFAEDDTAARQTPGGGALSEIRSIQLPIFEDGRFAGYEEVPMEAARTPDTVREEGGEEPPDTTLSVSQPN